MIDSCSCFDFIACVGERLIQCLMKPNKKWPQSLPAITEKEAAQTIGAMLIKQQYIHRSEKDPSKKGFLHVIIFFKLLKLLLLI